MSYLCLQQDEFDCGFACMKMFLATIFKNKKYLFLVKDYFKEEMSLKEIKEELSLYNCETKGVEIEDINELYKRENSIVLISLEGKKHFTFLRKATSKEVYLLDPKLGEIKILKEEFEKMFLSYSLIFSSKGNDILKENNDLEVSPSIYIFLMFSYILDFMILYLGTFYFKNQNSLLICSLLIIIFILNIFLKLVFYKMYENKIDKELILPLISKLEGKKVKKDTYPLLVNVKNETIGNVASLISISVTIIFGSFILCLDNLLYIFSLIFIFLMGFYKFKCNNKNRLIENNIAKLEHEMINESSLISEDYYKKICFYTDKYLKNDFIYKIIKIFVLSIFIIFLMQFNKIFSFQYFIFYFVILMFIDSKIENLYKLKDKNLIRDMHINEFNSLKKYLLSEE